MKRPGVAALLFFGACPELGACRGPLTSVGTYREESAPRDSGSAANDAAPRADAGPGGFYLEAEESVLSGGYVVEAAAETSGGAYLSPPPDATSSEAPGAARAIYVFELPEASDYVFWGRIHSPDASHNAVWFRIDDGSWYVWRLSTGEDWFWAPFHDGAEYGRTLRFPLAPGSHTLQIGNYHDGVGLDRFYVTRGDEIPPGNDTPCNPPHSIRLNGECVPSCGSLRGNLCGPVNCANKEPLAVYDCDVCCIGP